MLLFQFLQSFFRSQKPRYGFLIRKQMHQDALHKEGRWDIYEGHSSTDEHILLPLRDHEFFR